MQYLRAIAAVAVVLVHASTTLAGTEGARIPFYAGSYGVDLFFVISGFVMFYTTADRPMTPGAFFLRRCVRIIPIYYLLTAFAFILVLIAPKFGDVFSRAPLDFLRSLLFVPYFNHLYNDARPEIQQGWTLNYEMFFYVVFAVCLWLKAEYRLWACIGTFAALTVLGVLIHPTNVYATTYTNPILLEFVFGIVIGYFLLMHDKAFSRLVIALMVAAIVCFACVYGLGMSNRLLIAGVPAAAILGGAIWLERKGRVPHWPLFLLLGDASYSLYLLHTFVLSGLKHILVRWLDVSLTSTHIIFMASGLILALILSVVFYKVVEKPITIQLQAFFKRPART